MEVLIQSANGRLGALALSRVVGPNLVKGLLASVLIHAAVVSLPILMLLLQGERVVPEVISVELPPDVLIRINPQRPSMPTLEVSRPDLTRAKVPLAVEEEPILKPDEKIASQGEINQGLASKSLDLDAVGGGGAVAILDAPPIEEPIPDPKIFQPVEFYPQALDINPQPDYPELAKTAGMTGRVVMQVYVDRFGNAREWHILKADPQGLGFEDEVLKVISKWKFTPAIQQGNAVGVWVSVPFKFQIK